MSDFSPEATVHVYTFNNSIGFPLMEVVPVSQIDKDIWEADINGTHLAICTGFRTDDSDWQESDIFLPFELPGVVRLRDALTQFIEGKWANLGVNNLPVFPGEGCTLEKKDPGTPSS